MLEVGDVEGSMKKAAEYQQMKEYCAVQAKKQLKDGTQAEIEGRLSEAKESYQGMLRTIERQRENMRAMRVDSINKLSKKHQKEMEELEERWSSEKVLRKYNKVSQSIRCLKIQSYRLLKAHRYDESKKVEEMIAKAEEDEAAERRREMINDFSVARSLLLKKQKNEMETCEFGWRTREEEYNSAVNKDLEVAENRIKKIENELVSSNDEDALWNLHSKTIAYTPMRHKSPTIKRRSIRLRNSIQYNRLKIPPLFPSKCSSRTEI